MRSPGSALCTISSSALAVVARRLFLFALLFSIAVGHVVEVDSGGRSIHVDSLGDLFQNDDRPRHKGHRGHVRREAKGGVQAAAHKDPLKHPDAAYFATLLLEASLNARHGQRTKNPPGSSPWEVHVVEEHHQALRWWLRDAMHRSKVHEASLLASFGDKEKRRILVHVDSHADIGVDVWSPLPHHVVAGGRPAFAKFMAQEADIGSFISAGIMSGLVDDVVWLRSSFPNCTYNGPTLGLHRAGFFLTGDRSAICQRILSSDSSWAKGSDADLHISSEPFDTCDPDNIKALHGPVVTFNLLVTDLPSLEHGLKRLLNRGGEHTVAEWYLDVDEDFFASYIPGWHSLADFLRADFSVKRLKRIKVVLSQLHDACGYQHDELLMKLVRQLPQRAERWRPWKTKAACQLPKQLKADLRQVTKGFTKRQLKAWKKGFEWLSNSEYGGSDVSQIFETGRSMPDRVPSERELNSIFLEFEAAVSHVADVLGHPQVITACRSILNGYMPRKMWQHVEPRLQTALRRALRQPHIHHVVDKDDPPTTLYRGME